MNQYCNACSLELKIYDGRVKYCFDCRRQKRLAVNKAYRNKVKAEIAAGAWEYHYRRYKYSAHKRNISFSLEPEDFEKYWQKPCHYCNAPIKTIGLDRYNSRAGYEVDNIVPCCIDCNMMKRAQHGDVFLQKCRRIAQNHAQPHT